MCSLEFPDLQQLYLTYAGQDFLVIGVDPGGLGGGETEDHVLDLIAQTGVTFPVAWDDGTYHDYAWPPAIAPYPRDALIGRDGTIAYLASEYHAEALETALLEALTE